MSYCEPILLHPVKIVKEWVGQAAYQPVSGGMLCSWREAELAQGSAAELQNVTDMAERLG